MQPSVVSTVKRQNGIRATPAGSEMNVRTIGSMRVKNTVAAPYFANQSSAHFRCDGLMCSLLAVLLEDVDAAVVADRVGDPRADDVRERAASRRPRTASTPRGRR